MKKYNDKAIKEIYKDARILIDIRNQKIDDLCKSSFKNIKPPIKGKVTRKKLEKRNVILAFSPKYECCWIEQNRKRITEIIKL